MARYWGRSRRERDELAAVRAELDELRARVGAGGPLDGATPTPAMLERMLALERWLAHHPPPPTLVSVVLTTFERPPLLAEAIASVQAQTHEHWELIVVDAGSGDETPQLLAAIDDGRVRPVAAERLATPAARNRALDLARGELVAYLDDDNVMLPGWLAAVAWAFERHPDVDVLYGTRVVEDESMFGSPARLPRILMTDFDRASLERANFTDANVIAHRARLPDARFDEGLPGVSDWDLMLRLSARKPPLALPALAALYRTTAPHKQSATDRFRESYATLLARIDARR